MSINLLRIKGASRKLRYILRSPKKDPLPKLTKTILLMNIVYFSNCETVYTGESKQSLKSISDKHKRSDGTVKRMKLRKTVGKQIRTLSEISRKLLIEKAG